MSLILNYINSNNLSLITWLDAALPNIRVNANAGFTWTNKGGAASGDGTQTAISAYPSLSTDGVTFPVNSFLKLRTPGLITGIDYSILMVFKGQISSESTVITIHKENTSAPLVSLAVAESSIKQTYSPSILQTARSSSLSSTEDVSKVAIVHDTKHKRSTFYRNGVTSGTLENLDNFYTVNDGDVLLSGQGLPPLYHLLIFNGKLSTTQVQYILDTLVLTTPGLTPNLSWDLLTEESWNGITDVSWDNML